MDPLIDIRIVRDSISRSEIVALCEKRFGDMVKGVADISRGVVAWGGELHADEEQVLLADGSLQADLWGFNVYHALPREEWIEFDSMINIRPSQGNRSRSVELPDVREKISTLVNGMITE